MDHKCECKLCQKQREYQKKYQAKLRKQFKELKARYLKEGGISNGAKEGNKTT